MLIVEVKKGNVDRALKVMRRKVRLTKQLLHLRNGRQYTKKIGDKKDSNYKRLNITKNIWMI